MPAQYSVATSTVLCLGLHSIKASALPVSFFSCFSSLGSSDHAITLKCARMEDSPKLCASFRYVSIHSLLIWFALLYLASECIFLADFSNLRRFSSLLSKKNIGCRCGYSLGVIPPERQRTTGSRFCPWIVFHTSYSPIPCWVNRPCPKACADTACCVISKF